MKAEQIKQRAAWLLQCRATQSYAAFAEDQCLSLDDILRAVAGGEVEAYRASRKHRDPCPSCGHALAYSLCGVCGYRESQDPSLERTRLVIQGGSE